MQVKELQKQLQEEINLNLALASAAAHSSSTFSDSFQLPAKVSLSIFGFHSFKLLFVVIISFSDMDCRPKSFWVALLFWRSRYQSLNKN